MEEARDRVLLLSARLRLLPLGTFNADSSATEVSPSITTRTELLSGPNTAER